MYVTWLRPSVVNFVEIHTNNFSVNVISMKTMPCENVSSDICGQRRTRSAFASTQFDQGFCYPLIEALDTIKCINEELAHVLDEYESVHFAHAQRHLFVWHGPYNFLIHFPTIALTPFASHRLANCLTFRIF